MDFTNTFLQVIDLRSFSALWYWIVVAVVWSQASYYIIGVPYDMVQRARQLGGGAHEDLEILARIHANRALFITSQSGHWLTGFVFFFHSTMLTLALWFDMEFPAAIELIFLPMTLVALLGLRLARRITEEEPQGAALVRLLLRQRLATQAIGMIAIFATATYAMYDLLFVPRYW